MEIDYFFFFVLSVSRNNKNGFLQRYSTRHQCWNIGKTSCIHTIYIIILYKNKAAYSTHSVCITVNRMLRSMIERNMHW